MKTLLLIRHAHAESAHYGMNDFDRSLSIRGKQEAQNTAEKLLHRNIAVDGWICSSSSRTLQTTKILHNHINPEIKNLRCMDGLYQASSMQLSAQVIQLPNEWSTAAIIAHNPGITEFANKLSDNFHIDDMPTAGVVAVCSEAEQWLDFLSKPIRFLFFVQPN